MIDEFKQATSQDGYEKRLLDAFNSEDRGTFEMVLREVKGLLPGTLALPEGWKVNDGKFHTVGGVEIPIHIPSGESSVICLCRDMSRLHDPARYFRWSLAGTSDDIVAYRLNIG